MEENARGIYPAMDETSLRKRRMQLAVNQEVSIECSQYLSSLSILVSTWKRFSKHLSAMR